MEVGKTYKAGDIWEEEKNTTLYAMWSATEYEVTFDANGGKVEPESKPVVYDGEYGSLPTPIRVGYTFTGWYTEQEGGTQIISTTKYTIEENQTIYAVWKINQYTVYWNANGGTVSPTSTNGNYGTSVALPTPTRTNYTFNGWYTAASGGTKVTSVTIPANNITYYAQWKQSTIQVTFIDVANTSKKFTAVFNAGATLTSNSSHQYGTGGVGPNSYNVASLMSNVTSFGLSWRFNSAGLHFCRNGNWVWCYICTSSSGTTYQSLPFTPTNGSTYYFKKDGWSY